MILQKPNQIKSNQFKQNNIIETKTYNKLNIIENDMIHYSNQTFRSEI